MPAEWYCGLATTNQPGPQGPTYPLSKIIGVNMPRTKPTDKINWQGKPRQRAQGGGRPPILNETAKRRQVIATDEVWEWLKSYGDGNASEGLRRLWGEKTQAAINSTDE